VLAWRAVRDQYTQAELDELVAATAPRVGWDFSRMKAVSAPTPWEYSEVVARYLRPSDEVLDIGTGDGVRFASLAGKFRRGLGIDPDPEMVRLAAQQAGPENLEFRLGDARLEDVASTFPVIINRHAELDWRAIAAHLEPGGYFITQQVGERNMACVRAALDQPEAGPVIDAGQLAGAGLRLVAYGEYDVEYVVGDIESLVFWLSALDALHADLDGAAAVASAAALNKILAGNVDERGFVTNEHRYLVVAQAGW
jgi:SAM-dependent methyltransferase